MKLTRVEQLFDGSRLIFYFTAEGRVDFRELVRELAGASSTRGSRCGRSASATRRKMLGGYGSCGRPLCCTTWLQTFEPVSIKMAKQQELSLNPSKLSGLCGRLKCCLRYELPNAKGVHARRLRRTRAAAKPHGLRRRRLRLRQLRLRRRLRRLPRPVDADLPRIAITVGDPAGIGPEMPPRRRPIRECARSASRSSTDPDLAGARSGPVRLSAGGRAAPPTTRSSARSTMRRHGASTPSRRRRSTRRRLRRRAAVERPHRSARAPDGRAAVRDDVLFGGAAGRARHRARRRLPTCPRLLTPSVSWSDDRADGARAAALRHRRAAARARRPEPARRRARADRARGDDVLAPAVEACRPRGIDVAGPVAGGHRLRARARGEFDAVVACYHDQGLIPVKLLAFGQAVNVTLGLPIVRTSVDHGTAFDIAGRGMADPASMIAAVTAARLARRSRTERTWRPSCG